MQRKQTTLNDSRKQALSTRTRNEAYNVNLIC